MSATLSFWIVIATLAIGTFLLRSLPLWTHGRLPVPPLVERLLKYVPPAALTALVAPGVLYASHSTGYDFEPARIVAGAAALVVALKWRNMAATLVAGMCVLWIAQALIG